MRVAKTLALFLSMVDSPSPRKLDPTLCRFVVVEDDIFVADLLRIALQRRFEPKELHVFSRALDGLEHCRQSPPELLITDLGLPDLNGLEFIRRLRPFCAETRIIVLTGSHATSGLPGALLSLGVAGYLDKASAFDNTVAAVRRVLEGGMYFSASGVNSNPPPRAVARGTSAVRPEVLSSRELEIARMVASGMISKEIADRLDLSPRTVEKARSRILAKLNLGDVPGLVRWCVQHGMV